MSSEAYKSLRFLKIWGNHKIHKQKIYCLFFSFHFHAASGFFHLLFNSSHSNRNSQLIKLCNMNNLLLCFRYHKLYCILSFQTKLIDPSMLFLAKRSQNNETRAKKRKAERTQRTGGHQILKIVWLMLSQDRFFLQDLNTHIQTCIFSPRFRSLNFHTPHI